MDELERKKHLALQAVVLKIKDLISEYLEKYYPELEEKSLMAKDKE